MTWWYHIYLTLVLALALWFPCCVGEPPCPFCSGDADTITVTLGGFLDGECSCDSINGTYILTRSVTDPCLWVAANQSVSCSYYGTAWFRLNARVATLVGGNWGWKVGWELTSPLAFGTSIVNWKWDSGDAVAFDCTATRVTSIANIYETPPPWSIGCGNLNGVTCQVN